MLNAEIQRLFRDLHELPGFRADISDRHRNGRVAVIGIFIHADIERDNIPLLERAGIGNAMYHLFIDRTADAARKAVISFK